MEKNEPRNNSGKWVIAVMLAVALLMSILWWKFVPRTNPKDADPGSPYYSPPPKEPKPQKP